METIELIEKAKKGDPDAYAELMRDHINNLYRTAFAILLNEQDAEDSVQETLFTCWKKISGLKKPEYFRTWLTRILINQSYEIRRKRKTYIPLDEVPEVSAEPRDYLELKEALMILDEKFRLPVVLFYFEGYSVEEIAGILSITKSGVRMRLLRARERLRSYLQDPSAEAKKE